MSKSLHNYFYDRRVEKEAVMVINKKQIGK